VCSQASIGASSALGDDVVIGCGAAVKDHVCIVANSRVAARSGVVRDIDTAGDYAGYPAMPADDFKQQVGRREWGRIWERRGRERLYLP